MSARATIVFGTLLLAAAGCSLTALNPNCPNGYQLDDPTQKCVCATDEGCPVDYRCEMGLCQCRGDSCCPQGYS